jgi:hypothetical protein
MTTAMLVDGSKRRARHGDRVYDGSASMAYGELEGERVRGVSGDLGFARERGTPGRSLSALGSRWIDDTAAN